MLRLSLLLVLLLASSAVGQSIKVPDPVKRAALNACKIDTFYGGGASGGTTGTYFVQGGIGYVYTCAHAHEQPYNKTRVSFWTGELFTADVVHKDHRVDFAVLRLSGKPKELPGVKWGRPLPDNLFFYAGYVHGKDPSVAAGYIKGQFGATSLEVEGVSIEGMSGGPVFNSQGELICNVYARTSDGLSMICNNPNDVRPYIGQLFPRIGTQIGAPIQFPDLLPRGRLQPSPRWGGSLPQGGLGQCGPNDCKPQQPRPLLPRGPCDCKERLGSLEGDIEQIKKQIQELQGKLLTPPSDPQEHSILERRVSVLEAKLDYAKIAKHIADNGQAGPAGPAGKDGLNGKDGADGKDGLSVDPDALGQQVADHVRATLPDIVIEVEDKNGRVARRVQKLSDGHARFRFKFHEGQIGKPESE